MTKEITAEQERQFKEYVKGEMDSLLMKGGGCYPFDPEHIREAITEASDDDLTTYSDLLEFYEGFYPPSNIPGNYMEVIIYSYWKKQAKESALIRAEREFGFFMTGV